MQFSDKLNYLFELANAEGKELAAAMNVTPPQISKMRRGIRGMPKNQEAAQVLSGFFAKRCMSDYQLAALASAIRIPHIQNIGDEAALASVLMDWLGDENDPDEYAARKAGDFLRKFGMPDETIADGPEHELRKVLSAGQVCFFAYYGNDGKRLAVRTFLAHLAQQEHAKTISVVIDDDPSWISDDPAFDRELQQSTVRLLNQGYTFRRIAGPIPDMDRAFESLNRWFPLYLTGKATSYYYRRMRDNLYHMTMFVVPGVAVMFSFSVGGTPQSDAVSFFTTDERTVSSMAREFEHYIAVCDPVMKVHDKDTSPKRVYESLLEYDSCKGNCMQRSNGLSFITLPWEVAISLNSDYGPDEKSEFLTTFAKRYKKFQTNIQQYAFTDIIRLADANDIINGRVLIPVAVVLGGRPQYYAPAQYIQHLNAILYQLKHRPNYRVVLRRPEDDDQSIVYVKEGVTALLFRAIHPFTVFEVAERYLVDAFTELLRRLTPISVNEATYRRSVITEIEALIAEVERRLGEAGQG